jgi:N6-adenosine-specific RNA methylase IME4
MTLFGLKARVALGVGWWVRGVSEPILICRRGRVRIPKNPYAGLLAKRLEHSRKPESIYAMAERFNGPYLELFARRRRAGWDAFGNEVEGSVTLEGG